MSCRFRSEWLWAGTLAWLSAAPLAMACAETKRQRAEPPPAMASSAPGPVEPIAAPRAAESGDARELIQRLDGQQPQLISAALAGLLRSVEPEQNADLRRRALELTAHGDPGVRGRALRLLASLARRSVPAWPARGTGWGPRHGVAVRTSLHRPAYVPVSLWEATLARAWAARIDPHPYVRAEACEALARLGYIQAIHGLVRLIDDRQPSRYELEGFALEDGRPGKLRHEIPDRSLVADSALHAIETLSAGQLRLESIDPRQPAGSASGNAQRVRTWYTQHARDRVPLPSPEPLLPADTRYRRTAPSGVERRGPRIEGRVQSVLDGESRWAK